MAYRVVIVDDEPIVRMDIRQMLEEEGYEVAGEAGDGFDAVEMCRRIMPDLVLMDVKMPVFDGLTAAKTISSEGLATAVVMLTAFGDSEILNEAKEAGVTGYLVKPVEKRFMIPAIEVAIEQGRRLGKTRDEKNDALNRLEDEKMINRAVSILSEKEGIGAAESYSRLRVLATDKKLKIAVIARAIVDQAQMNDKHKQAVDALMDKKGISRGDAVKRIKARAAKDKITREEAAREILKEL